jgi:hypothetical protein
LKITSLIGWTNQRGERAQIRKREDGKLFGWMLQLGLLVCAMFQAFANAIYVTWRRPNMQGSEETITVLTLACLLLTYFPSNEKFMLQNAHF